MFDPLHQQQVCSIQEQSQSVKELSICGPNNLFESIIISRRIYPMERRSHREIQYLECILGARLVKQAGSYMSQKIIEQKVLIFKIINRKPQMKISKSHTKSIHQLKITDLIKKEQQTQLDVTQKYNRFKKSASLTPYYLSQARLNKITSIYRSLTTDKIRAHSHSNSQRNSQPSNNKKQHPSPFAQVTLNSFVDRDSKAKQRLTIDKGAENHPPIGSASDQHIQLAVRMKSLSSKLSDILQLRADERFLKEFSMLCDSAKQLPDGREGKDAKQQLSQCFRLFQQCCLRRQKMTVSEVKKTYGKLEEEFNSIQCDLKRKNIRALLYQKDIQKYQLQLKQLNQQILDLKSKYDKPQADIGVGTEDTTSSSEQNIFLPTQWLTINQHTQLLKYSQNGFQQTPQLAHQTFQLEQCTKKMHMYSQRLKEMLGVMVVLQREGVDVERIYSEVLNGRIDVSEDQNENFARSAAKIRKQQHKIYKRYKNLKLNSSGEADDSIISSADGLSFNYEDKSIEEEAYTIRNEYKCKKDLGKEMKDRLKLDFRVLYEEADVYDDQFDQQSMPGNAPTI